MSDAQDRTDELTVSQRTCLRLVGEGLSSKEIALATGLSPRTVDQYVNRAAMILGASNRREAARKLAELDSQPLNKLQLKPQPVATLGNPDNLDPAPSIGTPPGPVGQVLFWLPPLGGKRHDLTPSQTIERTIRAAVLAAAGFASIVATAAWLQTLLS